MTQFLKIDNRDYLVITPGYKSIDASVSHEFKEKLINIIDEGNNYIVIDLINVNYIDSIGLAGLISLLKNTKDTGDIALSNLNEAIKTYFRLTRMDRVFKLYQNRN